MTYKTRKKHIKKQHRHRGANDLLNYLTLLDDSTIFHKNGGFSKHYIYQPPDMESSTDIELDSLSQLWQQALSFLGDGWMVETNVVTEPYQSQSHSKEYPELVSALIDDERQQRLQESESQYFKSTYYLSLSYRPKNIMASKLQRFFFNDKNNYKSITKQLNEFNAKASEFITYLKSQCTVTTVHAEQLISFLHLSLTGINQKVAAPYNGAFLDCYLSSQDFAGAARPKIGNNYIKVLCIDDLPTHSYPCILDALTQFPIPYRWSSRFVPMDKATTQNYLKKVERNWSSKAIGLMGVLKESLGMPVQLDRDAENMAEQIRESKAENSAGECGYGFYNSVIVLMHHDYDLLNEVAGEVANTIQQLNFRVRVEGMNTVESYLGSLPAHGEYNLRNMPVDSRFVSHALPMSQVYQGEDQAPCPYYSSSSRGSCHTCCERSAAGPKRSPALLLTATQGSRPFWLNLHIEDVGHSAILGPTGTGKSTLVAAMVAAHRQYTDSRIIILDKNYSHRVIVKSLQGNYYDLAKEDCQLAPLARVNKEDAYSQQQAIEWLTEICLLQNELINPERKKAIADAVSRLADEPDEFKTLDYLTLQEPALRQAINTINKGAYRNLLSGVKSAFTSNSIIAFEMGALMGKDPLNIAVIKAMFNELEFAFQDKKPTLLILEEAWLYLRHPLFQEKLVDWFKTLRKMNVAVIFVSQELSDIASSEAASVIQNSCSTRIYLPNNKANEPAVKEFYERFGLNGRQIDIIRTALPKRDYYYNSVLGNRLFNLDLGELAKAFLCVSSREDEKTFSKIHSDNPDWVVEWLKYKKCDGWVEHVKENYLS